MTTYIARHNGQTFTTTAGGAKFMVLEGINKARLIATTERHLEAATRRLGSWVGQLGESEYSLDMERLQAKEVKNIEKRLAAILEVEGPVVYQRVSTHSTKLNADKRARRVGDSVVVATEVVA